MMTMSHFSLICTRVVKLVAAFSAISRVVFRMPVKCLIPASECFLFVSTLLLFQP